jgi:hypothetical protein
MLLEKKVRSLFRSVVPPSLKVPSVPQRAEPRRWKVEELFLALPHAPLEFRFSARVSKAFTRLTLSTSAATWQRRRRALHQPQLESIFEAIQAHTQQSLEHAHSKSESARVQARAPLLDGVCVCDLGAGKGLLGKRGRSHFARTLVL